MAAAGAIWAHHQPAGQTIQAIQSMRPAPLAGPAGGPGGTGGNSGSGGDSATISANDFLTLLVTEMQNQDPTADTDPNEYINQLVQVNSLEQLIDINQNLATALGDGSGATPQGAPSTAVSGAAQGVASSAAAGAHSAAHSSAHPGSALGRAQSTSSTSHLVPGQAGAPSKPAPGNLAVPKEKPAAHRVAEALGGRSHAS